ncbi:MAG: hypothetical protein CDV28_10275 [Candidatus Electronema aureum]|uniref:Uncharacterized protein n=1 Tax=Candidatus Electronema aureum TaxID=2005002 RepID=A0A521G4N8_9BACT|nr:MAG: hypothetical protein CDV28_10275 [Candidatus Electronema aureum]
MKIDRLKRINRFRQIRPNSVTDDGSLCLELRNSFDKTMIFNAEKSPYCQFDVIALRVF